MTAAAVLEHRIAEHDEWIESGEAGEHPYRCECAADGCPACREAEDEMRATDYAWMTS